MIATDADAHALHARVLAAHRARHQAVADLAGMLVLALETQVYRALGFSRLVDYTRVFLDLGVRETRELVRLGRKLPELPVTDTALRDGVLSWSKAREISRVATRETEAAWVACARTATSRELEALVARSRAGDLPPEPNEERAPKRRRIVFDMEATDAEVLELCLALLKAQSGLKDDEFDAGAALAAIARRVLADAPDGQRDSVRSDGVATTQSTTVAPTGEPYRIVLQHCPSCAHTEGLHSEVSDTVALQAACDAEVIEMRPGPDQGHASRTVPPARRRIVLHRDGWKCAVPHCRCRLWLDVHHVRMRSCGGGNEVSNLVTLCPLHHRLVHEGRLAIALGPDGVVVEHEDGRCEAA